MTQVHLITRDIFGTVEFEECEPGYWLGSLKIFGAWHHVELIEVADNEQGEQVGVGDESCNAQRIENLGVFADGGRFQTVEFNGREFALVITPFCD